MYYLLIQCSIFWQSSQSVLINLCYSPENESLSVYIKFCLLYNILEINYIILSNDYFSYIDI